MVGLLVFVMKKNGQISLSDLKLDPTRILASLPIDKNALASLKKTDTGSIGSKLSQTLDSLVTHPGRNKGPVVLGVQVTNETIGTITDVLIGLPPDQLKQITSVICTPK